MSNQNHADNPAIAAALAAAARETHILDGRYGFENSLVTKKESTVGDLELMRSWARFAGLECEVGGDWNRNSYKGPQALGGPWTVGARNWLVFEWDGSEGPVCDDEVHALRYIRSRAPLDILKAEAVARGLERGMPPESQRPCWLDRGDEVLWHTGGQWCSWATSGKHSVSPHKYSTENEALLTILGKVRGPLPESWTPIVVIPGKTQSSTLYREFWRETSFSGDDYLSYETPAEFRWQVSVNRYGTPRARLYLMASGGGPCVAETELPETNSDGQLKRDSTAWARDLIESGDVTRRILLPPAITSDEVLAWLREASPEEREAIFKEVSGE